MKLLLIAVLALIALWLGLRWVEQTLLFHPDRNLTFVPHTFGLPFEEMRTTTDDGVSIFGWFLPAVGRSPLAVILCHGNAGNISNRLTKARLLRGLGLSVLLFDYRGYGRSDGSPSELGTYRDAEAAYRFLTETKRLPADRIVIYGESLGAAVALELALRHPARALILESPFTSVADMSRELLPYLPIGKLLHYRYDNLSKIGSLRMPLLVLHSPQDDVVPFKMGRRLFEAAPDPKRFFELRGDHNQGFLDAGEAYPKAVAAFLATIHGKR